MNENGGTRKAPSRARTQREPEEYREIPHAGPPSADAADSNAPRIPPDPPSIFDSTFAGFSVLKRAKRAPPSIRETDRPLREFHIVHFIL